MTELVVQTKGLTKVYRSGFFRRKFVGLHGLDLEVRKGEVFGYIGPNGAGKTTTIKILMGLNFATAGEATVLGTSLGDPAAKRRIGYLPERPFFYDYLTAQEFLHFYGSLHGLSRGERDRKIDELLPLVHMERARHVPLRKFSKGMLQRVGVAQALINEPEFVVLDEPSSGLDPMGRLLIRDIIFRLKEQGTTILFASHILSDVEDICDRVGMIAGGKLRQVSTVRELVGHQVQCVECTFENLDDATLAQLPTDGVSREAEGRRTVEAADHDAAAQCVRLALAAGARLISVIPRRQTLESLFIDEMTAVERVDREKP
jgi:ABC-2 type transport system ATP-binding protein